MATKTSYKNGNGWGETVFARFEMTDEIEQAYEAWLAKQAPNPVEALEHLLGASYKVSFNRDAEGEAYTCSVTGTKEAKHNANTCLMTYSDSAEDALLLSTFKICVVYESGDWPLQGEKRRRR